jgi:hypothetical protein
MVARNDQPASCNDQLLEHLPGTFYAADQARLSKGKVAIAGGDELLYA